MKKLNTKEESMAYVLGMIQGLNMARIRFWGIGYDKNETAREIRKFTSDEIYRLKEIIDIETFGDEMFSDASDLIKQDS